MISLTCPPHPTTTPAHLLRTAAPLPAAAAIICRAGEGEARGVEGQVQQLLQDATDPDNLCKMYAGWASWL